MAGAFQTLDPRDLLISNENVTNTVWLNNSPTLNAYFTSSVQVASTTGQFYYNIFAGSAATGSVQFAIAYCDADGSGSLAYNPNVVGLLSIYPEIIYDYKEEEVSEEKEALSLSYKEIMERYSIRFNEVFEEMMG